MQRSAISIGIIGAGISGLSLAAQLINHPNMNITIFEKENKIGGRVYTEEVALNTYADMGANIIDFESKSQEQHIRSFLSTLTNNQQSALQLLTKPFFIYDKGTLRKGDYEKERYFYKQGFRQLITDIHRTILLYPLRCQIVTGCNITKIQKPTEKWIISSAQNKENKQFDFLVLSCNREGIIQILSVSKQEKLKQLRTHASLINYTKQISIAFETTQNIQFSSILFKNHPITFISSHLQKYPQQTPLLVIQTNQQFSSKHFNEDDSQIEEELRQQAPQFLKNLLGKCLRVKKWWPSLIESKTSSQLKQRQQLQNNLFITGDVFTGSSRVANAIESSILISEMIKSKL